MLDRLVFVMLEFPYCCYLDCRLCRRGIAFLIAAGPRFALVGPHTYVLILLRPLHDFLYDLHS